jgi:hypothetical protein
MSRRCKWRRRHRVDKKPANMLTGSRISSPVLLLEQTKALEPDQDGTAEIVTVLDDQRRYS